MSLISLVCDPLDYFRPTMMLDQHFGMGLDEDDFLEPTLPRRLRRMLLSSPYNRNWRSVASKTDKGSTVSLQNDRFQVSLDVQHFAPEEISVKTAGDTITVEGKHEEKKDEHGMISRHFIRKYSLPKGHDINSVESKLSSDGVLTITAPKVKDNKGAERQIPIALTGEPSQGAIEGKKAEPNEKGDAKK